MKRRTLFLTLLTLGTVLLAGAGGLVIAAAVPAETAALPPTTLSWGYLAAALVTAVGTLGAAYAVAAVGTAAVGALTEKPETFGRLLILVGLAEGIAIYGVIIAVLILNRLG
jgi:V/A-type H+/Na+-transporting ATPase subunit K